MGFIPEPILMVVVVVLALAVTVMVMVNHVILYYWGRNLVARKTYRNFCLTGGSRGGQPL